MLNMYTDLVIYKFYAKHNICLYVYMYFLSVDIYVIKYIHSNELCMCRHFSYTTYIYIYIKCRYFNICIH